MSLGKDVVWWLVAGMAQPPVSFDISLPEGAQLMTKSSHPISTRLLEQSRLAGLGRTISLGRAIGLGALIALGATANQAAFAFAGSPPLGQAELEQLFGAFDGDGDGVITGAELRTVVSSVRVGMADGEIDEMLATYDTNSDDVLQANEFDGFMGGFVSEGDDVTRQMEHTFLQFDTNRDGGLDASEIMALMEAGGRPMELREAKGIIFEADRDGDGRIDTAEFGQISG